MKYSIVTATYNRKDALSRCVDSVMQQTHQDFEMLVVDDGSTDGTSEMMQSISDNRIKYFPLHKNHGTATPARNFGIEKMSGDVLIIWDSDDELLPSALQELDELFSNNNDLDIGILSTTFIRDGKELSFPRMESGPLTQLDWFAGKKPKDAEIIGLKKDVVGEVRFKSRGIDYMFYAEIVGAKSDIKIEYKNVTSGLIYLESDDLSLTVARKKRNTELSISRTPILEEFIEKYGQLYVSAGRQPKLAGIYYGVALGRVLSGDYKKARDHLKKSLKLRFKFSVMVLLAILYVPFTKIYLKRFI